MNKCHVPITWVNDQAPAINDTHLNQYDGELDTLDDRVITLDTTKANQSDLLTAMADWDVDNATGDVTITLKSGQTITRHTNLGKIAINVRVIHDPTDPHYQEMEITMPDGTKDYVDFSAFVTQFEFVDSSEIHASVNSDGEVSFSLINGSITGAKLQPNYLADVTAQANIASGAATTATNKATLAESYAVGGTGTRAGEDTDNAKYYKEQAAAIVNMSFSGLSDTDFNNLQDGQVPVYDANSQTWKNDTPASSASDISYDNTSSGLTATDVQDAVDEVNGAMQYLYNNTGGKNLNSYPYQDGMGRAINGVTFTVNPDYSITATGTASGGNAFFISHDKSQSDNFLPNGTYILTGCPAGGDSQNGYSIVLEYKNTSNTIITLFDEGNGLEFTINGSYGNADGAPISLYPLVRNGTAMGTGGKTFYPMIRPASISDDTYVPYAMTNRELTPRATGLNFAQNVSLVGGGCYLFGNLLLIDALIRTDATFASGDVLFDLPYPTKERHDFVCNSHVSPGTFLKLNVAAGKTKAYLNLTPITSSPFSFMVNGVVEITK